MTTEPTIRQAHIGDVEAIAALTDAAYQKYVPLIGRKPQPMTADYALLVRDNPIWLLEVDQQLCGVLVLQHEAEQLLIYSIAIDPAYQKQGFGRMLLAWAEQQAQAAGYNNIRLYTNALMEANIALYKRVGYQETSREAYLTGVVVHMAKQLG